MSFLSFMTGAVIALAGYYVGLATGYKKGRNDERQQQVWDRLN